MKKKISILFAFAVVMTTSYNIYKSQSSVNLSELVLINIEALASIETLASIEESENYYHLFPYASSSRNECKLKNDPNGPESPSATYCN